MNKANTNSHKRLSATTPGRADKKSKSSEEKSDSAARVKPASLAMVNHARRQAVDTRQEAVDMVTVAAVARALRWSLLGEEAEEIELAPASTFIRQDIFRKDSEYSVFAYNAEGVSWKFGRPHNVEGAAEEEEETSDEVEEEETEEDVE